MSGPSKNKPTIRKSVEWFAEEMERQLRRNAHKGGWRQCDYIYLLKRLHEECDEVASCFPQLVGGKNNKAIIAECADVANFAMMIADNVSKEKEPFCMRVDCGICDMRRPTKETRCQFRNFGKESADEQA